MLLRNQIQPFTSIHCVYQNQNLHFYIDPQRELLRLDGILNPTVFAFLTHFLFVMRHFTVFRCESAFRLLLWRPYGAAEVSRQGRALGLRTRGDPNQHLPVGAATAGSHSSGGQRRLSGTTLQTVLLKGPTILEHRFKWSPNTPWDFILLTSKTFIAQSNNMSQNKHLWAFRHFKQIRAEKH